MIVMADADLDRAVEAAYAGAFWSAGQKCTARRRIYVEEEAYDLFRSAFLARDKQGKVGDPTATIEYHSRVPLLDLVHERLQGRR